MKTHKHSPIAGQDIDIPVFEPLLSKKQISGTKIIN